MSEQAAVTPAGHASAPKRAPWEPQPGENALWYARFLRFVALGPTRSVSLVAKGVRNYYPVPAHWPMKAKQENWRERAKAFDEAVQKDPTLLAQFVVLITTAADRLQDEEKAKMRGIAYIPGTDEDGYEDSHHVAV